MAAPGEVSPCAEIAAFEEMHLHDVDQAGRDLQEVSEHRAGRRAVDGDEAVPALHVEQRPLGERDRLDAGHAAQAIGDLIPDDGRDGTLRDGIERENPFGGEADVAMGQTLECGGEETGDKQDQKAEGDLRGDEGVHHAAAGVRIGSAFEYAGGLHGGSAESRRETEEQRHGESEREAECRARANRRGGTGAPDYRAD